MKAVEDYRRERLSIGRAAEEAGMSIAEFYPPASFHQPIQCVENLVHVFAGNVVPDNL